jgi:predicted transcriptional regulator
MTSEAIRQQIRESIEALKKSTARATRSKEAAIEYLTRLGLIEEEKNSKRTKTNKK